MAQLKTCNQCERTLPIEDYHGIWKGSPLRLHRCKDCINQAARKKYQKKKEGWKKTFEEPKHKRDAKECASCHHVKPIDEFGRRSDSPDGHLYYCKPCWRERTYKAMYKHYDRIEPEIAI